LRRQTYWQTGYRVSRPKGVLRRGELRQPNDFGLRLSIGFAGQKFRSRSHDAVICIYDEAGNVIETHEHADEFKEW
jgi:hypothetical protein